MNTRILIAIVFSIFLCQQVYAQDDEPVMSEATEVEGTWEVVLDLDKGEQQEIDTQFIRFESNRCHIRVDDDADWILSATISVDPSAMPAEIDFVGEGEGGDMVETLWGIYEMEQDILTICLGKPGDRPDEFKSSEVYPTILLVLRRVEEEEE